MLNHVEIALLYIYAGILGAGLISFVVCWVVNELVFQPIERYLTRQERKERVRKSLECYSNSELLNMTIGMFREYPAWSYYHEERMVELERRGVL